MTTPKVKQCSKCKKIKRHQSFFPDARNRSGLSSECKDCRATMTRAWKSRWPKEYNAREAFRRQEREFGVSFEEYTAMHEAQDGLCAICHKPEIRKHQSGKVKTLAIDHDHQTGAIRDLLCSSCNNALGAFGDSPELLLAAIAYLKKHAENPAKKIIPFKKPAKQVEPIEASEANCAVVP